MLISKEIRGSKESIAEQIRATSGQVVSAILFVEEASADPKDLTDEEVKKIFAEMQADTVSASHADDSREAIYTRMPGE